MYFDDSMYGYHDELPLLTYLHLNMNGNMQNNMYVKQKQKLLCSLVFFSTLYVLWFLCSFLSCFNYKIKRMKVLS